MIRLPGVVLLALLAAPPAPARASGDKGSEDAEKAFLEAYRGAGDDEKGRTAAVESLSGADDALKVSILLKKVLPRDDSPSVQAAAVSVLKGVKDAGALKEIGAEAQAKSPWPVRGAAIECLGGNGDPSAVDALRKVLKNDSDAKALAAAAFALAETRAPEAAAEMRKMLEHSAWQVRLGALEYYSVTKDKAYVPLLADRMEGETGRLRREIAEALEAITGKKYGMDAAKWRAYASGGEAAAEAAGQKPGEPAAGGRAVATGVAPVEPRYYGEPIYSDKVVFIIDCSLSMNEEMVVDREALERETGAVVSGGSAAGKGKEEPRDDDVMPIEWWKIRTRMDFAKSQLKFGISTLKKDQRFDVVWFSDSVKTWRGEMVAATRSTKYRAAEWVDALKCEGGTNTWGGLTAALNLVGRGTADENYSRGADTIFFMSDGMPSIGDIKDPDLILASIERIHKVRRVKIHVAHIGPTTLPFMKQIASLTGGKYKFFNARGETK